MRGGAGEGISKVRKNIGEAFRDPERMSEFMAERVTNISAEERAMRVQFITDFFERMEDIGMQPPWK